MKKVQIMLKGVEDVRAFVAVANKCDFDIDTYYNRMTIDAKSILGVLSMDLSRPMTVEYAGSHFELEEFLNSHSLVTGAA